MGHEIFQFSEPLLAVGDAVRAILVGLGELDDVEELVRLLYETPLQFFRHVLWGVVRGVVRGVMRGMVGVEVVEWRWWSGGGRIG